MEQGTCRPGEGDCSTTGNIIRGWCSMHYQRVRNGGDISAPRVTVIADMEERFFSHVRKEPGGCWVWTASINGDGYGEFGNGAGKVVGPHRWSYEHFVEPIPDGLQIDHLCHTRERLTCPGGRGCLHRRCVNPAHLEPVPQKINAERGVNSKYGEDVYAPLYVRWRAGEGQIALAAESGISQSQLSRAFSRIAAAVIPPPDGLLF
jgi:hypothetical protein